MRFLFLITICVISINVSATTYEESITWFEKKIENDFSSSIEVDDLWDEDIKYSLQQDKECKVTLRVIKQKKSIFLIKEGKIKTRSYSFNFGDLKNINIGSTKPKNQKLNSIDLIFNGKLVIRMGEYKLSKFGIPFSIEKKKLAKRFVTAIKHMRNICLSPEPF